MHEHKEYYNETHLRYTMSMQLENNRILLMALFAFCLMVHSSYILDVELKIFKFIGKHKHIIMYKI
jgi:hypothetical protein